MTPDTMALTDLLALHEALPTAWRAARLAGGFLRDERPNTLTVDTKSSPTDAVSMMDRRSEEIIVGIVLTDYPDDGFLGEEGGERPSSTGRRWIVDPLDATVNYLFGIPHWGVSIALEDARGTVMGLVAVPEADETYLAVRGHGSWLVTRGTGTRLTGSDCTDLSQALVSTGFGYSADRRSRQALVVADLIREVRDIRRSGCAVVDFCWLARGRTDAFYEYGLNPWDHAAGALICTEAGLAVTGLHSDSLDPIFVAAAPGIAHPLRSLLIELGADDMS